MHLLRTGYSWRGKMTDQNRLLNAEQAGRVLGLKAATVRRLAAGGELRAVRPTGKRALRFQLRDLEALVRRRRT